MQNVELWTQPNLWRADWIESPCRTKHTGEYKNLTDADWKQTPEPLLAKLRKQQELFFFTKFYTFRDRGVMTALWCPTKSRKNKNCGPVFDEEYIKEYLVNSASQICPESQASRMSGKEIWNLSWKMKSTFLAFSHWQSLTVCCIFAGAGDWTWWHRLPHSHQILQPGQSAKKSLGPESRDLRVLSEERQKHSKPHRCRTKSWSWICCRCDSSSHQQQHSVLLPQTLNLTLMHLFKPISFSRCLLGKWFSSHLFYIVYGKNSARGPTFSSMG